MIDKLLLNNQIITNKKKIQQARVQTINKLVQKIRKLKALAEKNPNNAKIKENLDKTPKIMACVKKLKVADIIRKILILSKKPAAILTNGRAPPDDVAVALLASNKILIMIASTLKTLLHLDDNNPGWKDEIMELSKRKKKLLGKTGQKEKKPVKSSLKSPLKEKSPIKKIAWKEENADGEKPIVSDEDAFAKGWVVEPVDEVLKKSVKPKAVPKQKVEKELANKEFISEEPSKSVVETPPTPLKTVRTVDPFFFTETGENYMSTVVIDRVQPEAPNDGLVRRERRRNARQPYKRDNNHRNQKVQTSLTSVKTQANDEKLHPSWAAKQKLKPTIAQFKGQKITFNDEGENQTVKSFGKNLHTSSSQHKPTREMESQLNLHPSWAAKQKLKPTITEFKGKKIKFDD